MVVWVVWKECTKQSTPYKYLLLKQKGPAEYQRAPFCSTLPSSSPFELTIEVNGAEGGIRTRTGFPTRPLNVRVYQVPPLRLEVCSKVSSTSYLFF